MNDDDDHLLDALSTALAPPPAEPSDHEIAALRHAVARHFAAPRPRPWWQPRRFGGRAPFADRAVTLLAAAALCTATAVAVAGSPVPAPVRALARAVGLPVDSAALADTRAAAGRLRGKLAAQDREGVARALEDLRSRIDALGERDRRALGEETAALFLEAEVFVTPLVPNAPPPAPRRSTARPAAAPRPEGDAIDLDDCDHPPPPICTLLEDEEEDEPKARDEVPDEAPPDTGEDDEEAEREREKTERDAERAAQKAERRAQHDAERAAQDVERRAERDAERLQQEAERLRHEADQAQQEAERAEHEAERAEHERERAARQARDKVHEKDERCEDTEREPPPEPEPDDDDD